ncbi:MAG: hypothetical protein ACE5GE_00425 [Phycisphaerae bacterium]
MLSVWVILGLAPVVSAVPSLGPLYVVCLVVGGGLLLVSTIFGGDVDGATDGALSADADLDLDFDVDADVPASPGFSLAEWFSVHFAVFFLASFGLLGTTLTWTSAMTPLIVLVVSLTGGLLVGQGAHQLLRWIKRTSGGKAVGQADYLNKPARVTLAIEPGKRGEVALKVRSRERFTAALAKHDDTGFKLGEQVVVVGYDNGTAQVVSKSEYDFLNNP